MLMLTVRIWGLLLEWGLEVSLQVPLPPLPIAALLVSLRVRM